MKTVILIVLLVSVGVSLLFYCPWTRTIHQKYTLKYDTVQRYLFIFMYAFYIDLCILAFVNYDNSIQLLNITANWGPSGHLNGADQISIGIGYLCTLLLCALPALVLKLVKTQHHTLYINGWY